MSQSRFAILGMLSLGPLSGYDIKRVTDEGLSFFWHESFGNLYPRLRQLEKAGLVQSAVERRRNGPPARVYRLTRIGRAALRRWLAEPARADVLRSEIVLRVFYGRAAPLDVTRRQLAAHLAASRQRLADLKQAERTARREGAASPHLPFWLLTIERGRLVAEAHIAWCKSAMRVVAGLAPRTRLSSPNEDRAGEPVTTPSARSRRS